MANASVTSAASSLASLGGVIVKTPNRFVCNCGVVADLHSI